MGLELDARSAIFAPGPATWPPGFDSTFVEQRLKEARSLVSVEWSVDPGLGLPIAPYELFIDDECSVERVEIDLTDASLDPKTGFATLVPIQYPAEATIYIRGRIAQAANGARVFALDASGGAIRETAQHATTGDPFILFGPGLRGVGSDQPVMLTQIKIAVVRHLIDRKCAEVAPPIDVPIYQQNVHGLGTVDAKTAAIWRLQGNTLARATDPGPSNPELLQEVHLKDVVAAAQELQTYQPFIELEQNFSQALVNPDWSYVETQIDGGSTIDMTIYPVRMLGLIKALGPIEASTLGFEVTVPSTKTPVLSRPELLNRFTGSLVPFAIIRIVGYFGATGFVDTGTIAGNIASPFARVVETYARLTFMDHEVDAIALAGEVSEPAILDDLATTDVDITLAYSGWLESSFVARTLPNESLVRDVQSRPKLFTPRPQLKDGADAKYPWFSDTGLAIPEVDTPAMGHLVYRRDEFGRWAKELETLSQLPPHPVEPPTILSMDVVYGANARIALEMVVSRSWKRRTPLDISVALAIGASVRDEPIRDLRPSDGVTSPSLGAHQTLTITFDATGLPVVNFSGAGQRPVVVPDQVDAGSGLPDDRSYTLTIPLGEAKQLFASSAVMMVVAVTADASNKISGANRRSAAAATRIQKIFDPRPPALASAPWQLVWSSRPNPQRRVRVFLQPPVAESGTLSGFRIWQATETALIDFVHEMSKTAEQDAVEQLAKRLRKTTDMSLRTQLLRNRITPILSSDAARTAFFSKFDAISDRVWPKDQGVELELSARSDGLIVLLFTGVSLAGAESVNVSEADLRVVAVPDRIPDKAPVLQVVTNLDNPDATPNACLLIAESRQPIDPGTLRVFWDSGEELDSEEEVLYRLDSSSCFPLRVQEAQEYLEDIGDLINRIRSPYHAIFLLLLPESWNLHHLTADMLRIQPAGPADEIPSRRAPMVSCFVKPGLGPTLSIGRREQSGNVMEWTIDHAGMSVITPPGYPDADVYLEASDGSVAHGPTSLKEVLATGMVLQIDNSTVTLSSVSTNGFEISASPWPIARTRLVVRDPLGRTAELELI